VRCVDDLASLRRAGLAGDRRHGNAATLTRLGPAGPGGARSGFPSGDLSVSRGECGDLIQLLCHDDLGVSLYAKRLERGCFLWSSRADGVVAVTAAQLSYLIERPGRSPLIG